ncbi:MAG: hypothetical protein U0264_10375 [Candidatus Kapaibacterium sp.]
MIQTLSAYIQQRYNPFLFGGLALYLLLFSYLPDVQAGALLMFVPYLMALFFIFRLYDDVMQYEHDAAKTERLTTNPGARKLLFRALLILMGMFLILMGIQSFILAGMILVFFLLNHILYRICIKSKTLAGYLPLLKYPFFVFLITASMGAETNGVEYWSMASIFMAFVVFEGLTDSTFALPARFSYILHILSFLALAGLSWSPMAGGVLAAGALLSTVGRYYQLSSSAYLYLVLLMVCRLMIVVGGW